MSAAVKMKGTVKRLRAYWRRPPAGEYVPYREVLMLALGVMGCRFATVFTLGFGSGNPYTGLTLGIDNEKLIILEYVVDYIAYGIVGFNAHFIDNHQLKGGKYRPLIKAGYASCALALLGLWLPFRPMLETGGASYWTALVLLFLLSAAQLFFQGWFITGCMHLINVITPNTDERARLFAVYSAITSLAPTLTNALIPALSASVGDTEYSVEAYRTAYTPFILIGLPISMLAYYGTRERLIVPKSRVMKISLSDAFYEVLYNRIFWIRCVDGWNDFLESAKNSIFSWSVSYQQILPLRYKGLVTLIVSNASLLNYAIMPSLLKRYGKKRMKIAVNLIQVFFVLGVRLVYKEHILLWIAIMFLDRMVNSRGIIDASIDADMRDNQHYLSGVRIDGPFSMVQTVTGAIVGQFTGLFIPWVWSRYGISFKDTNWELFRNKSVFYPLTDALLTISLVGSVIDIFPWFFYNLTDTDQRAVMRIIRIRTLVEDFGSPHMDKAQFLEGCDAVFSARAYSGKELLPVPKRRSDPSRGEILRYNEEIRIAATVMEELGRFSNVTGKTQLETAKAVIALGTGGFYTYGESACKAALSLPCRSAVEKRGRRQQIFYARSLEKSGRRIGAYYPNGFPEGAGAESGQVRITAREKNRRAGILKPYLSAQLTVKLADGYAHIDRYLDCYDIIKEAHDREKQRDRYRDEAQRASRGAEKLRRKTGVNMNR